MKTGLQEEDAAPLVAKCSLQTCFLIGEGMVQEFLGTLLFPISWWSERLDLPDDFGPQTAGIMGLGTSVWMHPGGLGERGGGEP